MIFIYFNIKFECFKSSIRDVLHYTFDNDYELKYKIDSDVHMSVYELPNLRIKEQNRAVKMFKNMYSKTMDTAAWLEMTEVKVAFSLKIHLIFII